MKPAAARLLLLNGPSAYRRLVGIVAGVAAGMGMLLVLLGAYLHMPERDSREAWMSNTGDSVEFNEADVAQIPDATDSTMLVATDIDYFDGLTVGIVTVATSGSTTIDQPDGRPLPGPGEFYASPRMAELIEDHPADQLGDRYGTMVGVIDDSMLKGPGQTAVLMGGEWTEVGETVGATVQESFATTTRYGQSSTFQVILAVGAISLLVPVVLLISIVSQLGAAERRERFATVRLIGAGRRAVAAVTGLEMMVAALLGGVLGVGVAALLRPLAATLAINGSRSYIADLTPGIVPTVVVIVAVAMLAAFTAWRRTYRDDVGAPGAARERSEKPVRWTRSLTLFIGLTLLTASGLAAASDDSPSDFLLLGLVIGFTAVAFGIVIAGPWVTRAAAVIVSRFARSAPTVVAGSRLKRHPRSTFRSVAGLVVAVFLVSTFAGVTAAIDKLATATDTPGLLDQDALLAAVRSDTDPEALLATMGDIEGVDGAVVAWGSTKYSGNAVLTAADARRIGAINVPDSDTVQVDMFDMLSSDILGTGEAPAVEPAAGIEGLDPFYVVVMTDGSPDSIERARTAFYTAGVIDLTPITREEFAGVGARQLTYELGQMAYLAMALAIGISALALTVATVAAALDRKRTFGLLRLSGMRVSQLRATVSIEAAVPLAATLLASVGLGFFVAWVFLRGLGAEFGVAWPDARYWIALSVSLMIGMAAIAASFTTVRKSTELGSTRFE